jgi:hypothetical protein
MNIQRNLSRAAGHHAQQACVGPVGEQESDSAADRRKQNAFGKHLAEQPRRSSPHGGTDSDFFLPYRGACQQNIGDIGAGDQQNESDDGHQNFERLAEIGAQYGTAVAAFGDGEALIKKSTSVDSGHLAGLGLKHLLEFDVETGFRLSKADAGLQATDDLKPLALVEWLLFKREIVVAGKDFALHGEWDPDVRINADRLALKLRRSNTDDIVRSTADANFAAKDVMRAAEAVLPEAVTDDGDGVRIAQFVNLRGECPAEDRIYAEYGKIGTADKDDAASHRFAALSNGFDFDGDRLRVTGRRENAGENLIVARELLEFGIGKPIAIAIPKTTPAALRIWIRQKDQPLRVLDGKTAEQHGIDDRENGRVGADAEGKSQHSDNREARAPRERADAVL